MKSDSDIHLEVRNLAVLSGCEIGELAKLQISDWQEIKGGSFEESLDAWHAGPKDQMLGVVFFLENSPVGMTLFKRPPLSPSWASRSAATIHGLKIVTPWQGRGLGHQSFKLAVDHLRKEWPAITKLMLAVDADNT